MLTIDLNQTCEKFFKNFDFKDGDDLIFNFNLSALRKSIYDNLDELKERRIESLATTHANFPEQNDIILENYNNLRNYGFYKIILNENRSKELKSTNIWTPVDTTILLQPQNEILISFYIMSITISFDEEEKKSTETLQTMVTKQTVKYFVNKINISILDTLEACVSLNPVTNIFTMDSEDYNKNSLLTFVRNSKDMFDSKVALITNETMETFGIKTPTIKTGNFIPISNREIFCIPKKDNIELFYLTPYKTTCFYYMGALRFTTNILIAGAITDVTKVTKLIVR